MRSVSLRAVVALFLVISVTRPSFGILQFYQVYKAEYLDGHSDKEYAATVNKTANRCFVCHQGKKSKKNHNEFGKHLIEPLDWKKDSKDKEKIAAALKKALALHVDPKNEKSETYLDRIKASKWPGGELTDLEKEPEKKEGETAEGGK